MDKTEQKMLNKRLFRTTSGEEARELMTAGANPIARSYGGIMPLGAWASRGNEDCIREALRLNPKLDVNRKDKEGMSALSHAATSRNGAGCIPLLIDHGANMDALEVPRFGMTPLMLAARGGNVDCMETLIANGASLDLQGRWKNTALMWSMGQPESVRVLLQAGADPLLTNKEGKSAADEADLATPAGQECHALMGAELAKRRAADLDRKLDQKCGSWVPPEASSQTTKAHQMPVLRGRQRF